MHIQEPKYLSGCDLNLVLFLFLSLFFSLSLSLSFISIKRLACPLSFIQPSWKLLQCPPICRFRCDLNLVIFFLPLSLSSPLLSLSLFLSFSLSLFLSFSLSPSVALLKTTSVSSHMLIHYLHQKRIPLNTTIESSHKTFH
jgi:hypothetical protein